MAVTQRDCSEDCHKVLLCPACVQLDESGDGGVVDQRADGWVLDQCAVLECVFNSSCPKTACRDGETERLETRD